MGLLSFLNRSQFNQNLGVREFRGSAFDGQATVNQYGQHDHGAGMRENALESGMDIATMVAGRLTSALSKRSRTSYPVMGGM